jgi:hypothetical protein
MKELEKIQLCKMFELFEYLEEHNQEASQNIKKYTYFDYTSTVIKHRGMSILIESLFLVEYHFGLGVYEVFDLETTKLYRYPNIEELLSSLKVLIKGRLI